MRGRKKMRFFSMRIFLEANWEVKQLRVNTSRHSWMPTEDLFYYVSKLHLLILKHKLKVTSIWKHRSGPSDQSPAHHIKSGNTQWFSLLGEICVWKLWKTPHDTQRSKQYIRNKSFYKFIPARLKYKVKFLESLYYRDRYSALTL